MHPTKIELKLSNPLSFRGNTTNLCTVNRELRRGMEMAAPTVAAPIIVVNCSLREILVIIALYT
jgi:hypothetical protein